MFSYVLFNGARMDEDAAREAQNDTRACITSAHVGAVMNGRYFVSCAICVNEDGARFRASIAIHDEQTGAKFSEWTKDGTVTLQRGETVAEAATRAINVAYDMMVARRFQAWSNRVPSKRPNKWAGIFDADYFTIQDEVGIALGKCAESVARFYGEEF